MEMGIKRGHEFLNREGIEGERSSVVVQGDLIGCRTGNGGKLSNS